MPTGVSTRPAASRCSIRETAALPALRWSASTRATDAPSTGATDGAATGSDATCTGAGSGVFSMTSGDRIRQRDGVPDYRHDLQFGVFITPVAGQADAVVELARLADVVGLDIVSFQDHPYQARFLDTWTLLSVVAAQTTNVRVAPNVANLPLRPPIVLAKSAASLDILSGGRVELGLGAGAFWDAIEAVGGPRWTPGQAVDALSEAIDVIRAMWDAGGAPASYAGT